MASISEDEIESLAQIVAQVHDRWVIDSDDERATGEAVANLMSEISWGDASVDALATVRRAIEIGYANALVDVRDGNFDAEIREWRPGLSDS